MEVDLVLHDEMLDHALRIDRVLRQPQGHMILSGSQWEWEIDSCQVCCLDQWIKSCATTR